jgi:hypothetical protein
MVAAKKSAKKTGKKKTAKKTAKKKTAKKKATRRSPRVTPSTPRPASPAQIEGYVGEYLGIKEQIEKIMKEDSRIRELLEKDIADETKTQGHLNFLKALVDRRATLQRRQTELDKAIRERTIAH